jgi:2-keto-4-pentenoate hydratase/2-oxohepta-3-ene-1,7-dioic acid hydratase in catechol pathway
LHPVAELIEFVSQAVTLEAGDVIITGTPAGVGGFSGDYLAAGDTVKVSIDGLGYLDTPIVS